MKHKLSRVHVLQYRTYLGRSMAGTTPTLFLLSGIFAMSLGEHFHCKADPKRVCAKVNEFVEMKWMFPTDVLPPKSEVSITLKHQQSKQKYYNKLIDERIDTKPTTMEHLSKLSNKDNNIVCTYTTGLVICKIEHISMTEGGNYTIQLEFDQGVDKLANTTEVYVNYDYSSWTSVSPKVPFETYAMGIFAFQNPADVFPAFPMKIIIWYSRHTIYKEQEQLISTNVSSETKEPVDLIPISHEGMPFANRSRYTYGQGRLTIHVWNMTREDRGLFQIAVFLSPIECPHRASELTHMVAFEPITDCLEPLPPTNCTSVTTVPVNKPSCDNDNCRRLENTLIGVSVGLSVTLLGTIVVFTVLYRRKNGQSQQVQAEVHELENLQNAG